eukprot:3437700-Rhodomonas_salina.1
MSLQNKQDDTYTYGVARWDLAHRQAVARAKRIQVGTRVSQTFWVTYTEEGAQRQRSKHHVFFALTLGFTEQGHAL